MKKQYKIHLNPKRLTSQQIARHKNFDALLQQFQAQPSSRKPIFRRLVYGSVAIAAAVAGLIFFSQFFNRKTYQQREQAFFAAQRFVQPPLEHIKPQFASFRLNPSIGGTYEHSSGSRLFIPAAAFVNKNGAAVTGEVTLHYREMHDFIDFFLSGIPMTYDSAGVTYNLESAGMIEVFAEQNGERVQLMHGKSIGVELISNVNMSPFINVPTGYNIYHLDESRRNWVYQEIDRMEVLDNAPVTESLNENSPFYPAQSAYQEKMQVIQIREATETARIEASIPKMKEPAKPQKAGNSDYVFDLDFKDLKKKDNGNQADETQQELTELYRQYEKMLWQVSPQSNISPERLQKEFSQVTGLSIRKLNNRDYELTLEKNGQSLAVVVNPVLSGSDYEKALTDFNRDFESWKKQTDEREARLATQKEALKKQVEAEKSLARQELEDKIAGLRAKGMDYAANEEIIKKKVLNRFSVSSFGIWNCDRPLPPEVLQLAANFKDQNGKPFNNRPAYLVDKNLNTVFRFLADGETVLRFNKNSNNLLWIMTEDNKIAVFRPENFGSIPPDVSKHTFVLQTIDKSVKDEKDIREILYL